MKKLAVVLGVAAVATFTGCKDPDYVGRRGQSPRNEATSIETEPVKPAVAVPAQDVQVAPAPNPEVVTVVDRPVEPVAEVKPLPKPVEPETTTYIVQNGDYLAKISKKYNVTINSIKRINNMNSDTIRVGQKLKLPGKIDVGAQTAPVPAATKKHGAIRRTTFAPYAGATKEYVVKNGDTLGSVAYGNGCNIRQLKQLNNLTGDALRIGQKLKVPADKAAKKDAPAKEQPVKTAKRDEPAKDVVAPTAAETPVAPVTAPAAETATTTPAEDTPAEAAPAPVTAAETTPAPAPAPATTTYVVQEGEDLTRLSIDFGVSTSVIREMNNLGENDTIKPGQVLKLPAEAQQ